MRSDPPLWVVRIDRHGAENNFPFYDEALARRVAGQFSQAVELCGGHAPFAATFKASPAPSDDASLEVTMKWVADALDSVGPVNYVVYRHVDAGPARQPVEITRVGAETTNVRVSAPACRIVWHARRVRNAALLFDGEAAVALKDTRKVEVVPAPDAFHEFDHKQHRPPVSYRVVPSAYMLSLRSKTGEVVSFPMLDADFAGQIAGALSHAVDACGGGLERY